MPSHETYSFGVNSQFNMFTFNISSILPKMEFLLCVLSNHSCSTLHRWRILTTWWVSGLLRPDLLPIFAPGLIILLITTTARCWAYMWFRLAWGEPGQCVWMTEVSAQTWTHWQTLTDPTGTCTYPFGRIWNNLIWCVKLVMLKLTSSSKLKCSLFHETVHCNSSYLLSMSPHT